jgi:phenylalanyl-tRNA synthetase alpha chain
MADAIDRIQQIEREAADSIAAASGTAELEELRVRYLGRKAELVTILRGIAELPAEERGAVGKSGNEVRNRLEELLDRRAGELDSQEISSRMVEGAVDVTLPGAPAPPVGHLHLITRTRRQIEDIMVGLGYRVLEGPEVELDYYNFTALNHPPGHPARMTQDTFYVAPGSISKAALGTARKAADGAAQDGADTPDEELVVLRTHTSPMQVRAMEAQEPPIFVIVPGKVYRRDSDATHSPMFHQIEGLWVDQRITFADLKGVLIEFLRKFFERADLQVRFRPSFFPFTEPSAEIDMSFGDGWLEIGGAGMVHPGVLRNVRIDSEAHQGFAFGMGADRLTMLRYGVSDLRLFFENDLRFLKQFN